MSSASRKRVDDCVHFSSSMGPYVDGELDPGRAADMEAHLVVCSECAERVALVRSMRVSMRRTAAANRCPTALRARVETTIAHERRRAVIAHGPAGDDATPPKLIPLRYAVALAAAAGIAFAMGMSRWAGDEERPRSLGEQPAAHRASIDAVLDQLITLHMHPLRPDVTDVDQLDRFNPDLGVRVPRPVFQPLGSHFVGARMHLVSGPSWLLQLEYRNRNGKNMTVYAFNPNVVAMRAARLRPSVVRTSPVLVGRLRGYSVAALEQAGVGYAVTADDPEPERIAVEMLDAIQRNSVEY